MIKCSSSSTIRSLTRLSLPPYSTRHSLSTPTPWLPKITPANLWSSRPFHNSPTFRDSSERSHYDTLGVPTNATKSDLKKRFYVLSKETHPDVASNRNDPTAADRFSRVSEAYAILGNDEKRKIYDRDVLPRFTQRSARQQQSGTYAGSRPATGLRARRGTFRGPPPSFYANKNPSPEEQARREQEAYNAGAPSGGSQPYAGGFDPSSYTSAGQWDPIFNPTPVYKTQTAEDVRRQHRRAQEMAAAQAHAEDESNFWARLIIVSGVLAFAVGVGSMVNRMSAASPRGGLVKGDGSRRSRQKETWATS